MHRQWISIDWHRFILLARTSFCMAMLKHYYIVRPSIMFMSQTDSSSLTPMIHYLKNKVGVVDFTKARGPFGPLGFKTLPLLGHLQNLLLPLYFWGNVSFLSKVLSFSLTLFWFDKKTCEIAMIHYLINKVGVVDFANAQGVVMF